MTPCGLFRWGCGVGGPRWYLESHNEVTFSFYLLSQTTAAASAAPKLHMENRNRMFCLPLLDLTALWMEGSLKAALFSKMGYFLVKKKKHRKTCCKRTFSDASWEGGQSLEPCIFVVSLDVCGLNVSTWTFWTQQFHGVSIFPWYFT